jgi:cytochrome b561
MIALLSTGLYMANWEAWALYPWHKSVGVLLFLIIIVRVFISLKNGMPAPVGNQSPWLHTLAKATHWALLGLTLIMPISGMLHSWSSGHGFGVFGFEISSSIPAPGNPEEVIARNETLSAIAESTHELAGYLLLALVTLHIAGALKHHLIDKDNTLKRMIKG